MDDATEQGERPDGTRPRVVVGVDGSTGARLALTWALAEAARRGAVLEVVSAYPVDFYWVDPWLLDRGRIDALRADTEARARDLVAAVRQEPSVVAVPGAADVPVQVVAVAGAPAEHLVRVAAGAALLVVGSRGRGGVRSTLLGSVALHCATHAPCPVTVVHPSTSTDPARVVVGVDGSPSAQAALAAAAEAAAERGADLEVVAAYQLPNYWSDVYVLVEESLAELEATARKRAEASVAEVLGDQPPAPVAVVTVEGPAGEALVQRAAGARLLVVGSRSRSGLPGMLLGSAALHCAVHAPCPVLVVHPRRDAEQARPAQTAAAAGS